MALALRPASLQTLSRCKIACSGRVCVFQLATQRCWSCNCGEHSVYIPQPATAHCVRHLDAHSASRLSHAVFPPQPSREARVSSHHLLAVCHTQWAVPSLKKDSSSSHRLDLVAQTQFNIDAPRIASVFRMRAADHPPIFVILTRCIAEMRRCVCGSLHRQLSCALAHEANEAFHLIWSWQCLPPREVARAHSPFRFVTRRFARRSIFGKPPRLFFASTWWHNLPPRR